MPFIPLKTEPFPHQSQFFDDFLFKLRNNFNILLAAEMGLGKTRMALSTIQDDQNTLIIIPPSLISTWIQQIHLHTHLSTQNIFLYHGSKRFTKLPDIKPLIVITTFNTIANDLFFNPNTPHNIFSLHKDFFQHIIVDEAHEIRNVNTKKHSAAINLMNSNPNAFKLAMTGTPIMNKLQDIVSISILIRNFKSPTSFDFTHFKNNNTIILKKEDNLKLPKKNIIKHELPTDILIDTVTSNYQHNNSDIPLTQLLRLRQISFHPFLVLNKNKESSPPPFLPHSPKTEKILDIIKQIPKNDKVIIFSEFVSVLNLLHFFIQRDLKLNTAWFTSKNKQLDSFLNDPNVPILLASIKCASQGLNLTVANHIIFTEFNFNPQVNNQAIDRIHRPGQYKTSFIHFFYHPNVDIFNIKLQNFKKDIAESLLTDKAPTREFNERPKLSSFLKPTI